MPRITAAEGFRLRVLAVDEPSAAVVRRIFAEYLDGNGDRAIAGSLNRDGVACPSARRLEQNRHRLADDWQGSTVRAILDNPRQPVLGAGLTETVLRALGAPDDAGTRVLLRPAQRGSSASPRTG